MDAQLQLLLDKTDVIRLRQKVTSHTGDFNIFRILRSENDEVNLHSRFLYELLSPSGSHGLGDTFLRLFAAECSLPALSYDTVQVRREHAQIDLLIQDNRHSIVIENKIWAGDQHEQLKRYHDYVKTLHRQPHLYYLTLTGDTPSEWSLGDLQEPVQPISYSQHINNWLTSCIKEAASHPTLREALTQYQLLIRQLSGTTMNNSEKFAIIDLLAQDSNAERAAIIARNWRHVQWHTEWDFWTELLALAEVTYQVMEEGKFSDDNISKMVHGSRGKNPYYGIQFSIGKLFGKDLVFKLERGWEPSYYGLIYCSDDENIRLAMSRAIQHLGTTASDAWAGWKTTADLFNFQEFDYSPSTQQLANREKRQKLVPKLWREIEDFIREATLAYTKEFDTDFEPLAAIPAK